MIAAVIPGFTSTCLVQTVGTAAFLYYRKVLAEIKLCKLMILPKEGIENRR
jgi:hypothetical protein